MRYLVTLILILCIDSSGAEDEKQLGVRPIVVEVTEDRILVNGEERSVDKLKEGLGNLIRVQRSTWVKFVAASDEGWGQVRPALQACFDTGAYNFEFLVKTEEQKISTVVGKWAAYGVGYVHLVTIQEDGTFRTVNFYYSATGVLDDDGTMHVPPGVQWGGSETGRLNLETGKVVLTEEQKERGTISITYSVIDGSLVCDVEAVTDERVSYSPVE